MNSVSLTQKCDGTYCDMAHYFNIKGEKDKQSRLAQALICENSIFIYNGGGLDVK